MRAVILVTLLLMGTAQAANVLGLFTFQGHSHFAMFQSLMKGLAARGHNVTVVSHFPLAKPIPNYRDISVKGALPSAINSFSVDFAREFKFMNLFYFLWHATADFCNATMRHPEFQKLIQSPPVGEYDVVVMEVFGADCAAGFASRLGAPVIAMMSSVMLPWGNDRFANPDNPSYIPNYFVPYKGSMTFLQRLYNVAMLVGTKLGFEWRCVPHMDQLNREILGDDLPSIRELVNNASLLLVNSHFSINQPRPLVPAVVEVGGLHIPEVPKKLPQAVQKFLDDASDVGVIVFTFGSLVRTETLPRNVLDTFISVFSKLPQKIVWKTDAAALREIGITLPKKFYTDTWVPQFDVLSHPNVRTFISHGGLMGTLEAIHTGVPVLGIPLFADQHLNIQNVVTQGAAIHLAFEDVTEESLTKALTDLSSTGSRYQTRAEELSRLFRDRPMSAMDTAIFWTEYVIRHQGAKHLRSSAMDLHWYQYLLLDVVAAVVIALLAIVFVIYSVTRRLFRRKSKPQTKKMKTK